MKRFARRLILAACCLLAAGAPTFPPALKATLTQPPWPPSDPGTIPKPSPTPVDPNEKEDAVSSALEDEDGRDSQKSGDAGTPSPSPSPSPAHPDAAAR